MNLYAGEKPFESVEDLVQDGLFTLYMQANNVEEYLQSARNTHVTQDTIPQTQDFTSVPHPEGEGDKEGSAAPAAEVRV